MNRVICMFAALLLFAGGASAFAATAVLQEGVSDADGANASYNSDVAYLHSGAGAALSSSDVNHQIGGLNGSIARAVMRWDLGSLAGKGTITGARVKLTFKPIRAEGAATLPSTYSLQLYRISAENKNWVDAEAHRSQARTGQSWYAASMLNGPFYDYLPVPAGEVILDQTYMNKTVVTIELKNFTMLRDWVQNPADNAGFLLKAPEFEALGTSGSYLYADLYADDVTSAPARYPDAVAADRPILEVDYSPQVATAIFQEGISDANGANAAYNSEVALLNSGYGGVLNAADSYHQIGGLNNNNFNRVLLRWDISSLNGKVSSADGLAGARLRLKFDSIRSEGAVALPPDPYYVELERIAPANASWIDAEAHRDQPHSGASWAGSIMLNTPGVDYLAEPAVRLKVTGGFNQTGFQKTELVFDLDPAQVEEILVPWIISNGNNAGFMLKIPRFETLGNDGTYMYANLIPDDATSAPGRYPNAVAADRPILEVDYYTGTGVPVELSSFATE